MQKLQEREWAFKGGITAFAALVFILMISIVGALVESASIQMTRSMKRATTRLALESVFAEYHVEMLKQYDLFVRVGGSEEMVPSRLQYYGASGMEHTLEEKQLLTDDGGHPFYEQAVSYAKDWVGLEDIEVANFTLGVDTDEQENMIWQQLGNLLDDVENPLQSVQDLKGRALLTLVKPKDVTISDRKIDQKDLPSVRELCTGNYDENYTDSATDKLFFVAYLTEHFTRYGKTNEEKELLYEQEYLLGGKDSDRKNLEQVCQEILQIRMAANYAYLCTDGTKKAEAEAMATGICSIILSPELIPVVKQGLLLGWAYGESIVDVRVLLQGKKVPLVKTAASWQLQLSNLSKLGTSGEVVEEKGDGSGLAYEAYLRALLAIKNKKTLCMRGLDLIERNLDIKVDDCITKVTVKSTLNLRGTIREEFQTKYGYL